MLSPMLEIQMASAHIKALRYEACLARRRAGMR